jgi:hypothetical protein
VDAINISIGVFLHLFTLFYGHFLNGTRCCGMI